VTRRRPVERVGRFMKGCRETVEATPRSAFTGRYESVMLPGAGGRIPNGPYGLYDSERDVCV